MEKGTLRGRDSEHSCYTFGADEKKGGKRTFPACVRDTIDSAVPYGNTYIDNHCCNLSQDTSVDEAELRSRFEEGTLSKVRMERPGTPVPWTAQASGCYELSMYIPLIRAMIVTCSSALINLK